jgi:hypothetical protein
MCLGCRLRAISSKANGKLFEYFWLLQYDRTPISETSYVGRLLSVKQQSVKTRQLSVDQW